MQIAPHVNVCRGYWPAYMLLLLFTWLGRTSWSLSLGGISVYTSESCSVLYGLVSPNGGEADDARSGSLSEWLRSNWGWSYTGSEESSVLWLENMHEYFKTMPSRNYSKSALLHSASTDKSDQLARCHSWRSLIQYYKSLHAWIWLKDYAWCGNNIISNTFWHLTTY